MKLLVKIEFKKIKNLAKKIAQKPLLTFLFLFFLSLFLSGLIYYQGIQSAEKKLKEKKEKAVEFDEKSYEEILKIWEEKERKFQNAESKEYLNPFNLERR